MGPKTAQPKSQSISCREFLHTLGQSCRSKSAALARRPKSLGARRSSSPLRVGPLSRSRLPSLGGRALSGGARTQESRGWATNSRHLPIINANKMASQSSGPREEAARRRRRRRTERKSGRGPSVRERPNLNLFLARSGRTIRTRARLSGQTGPFAGPDL